MGIYRKHENRICVQFVIIIDHDVDHELMYHGQSEINDVSNRDSRDERAFKFLVTINVELLSNEDRICISIYLANVYGALVSIYNYLCLM